MTSASLSGSPGSGIQNETFDVSVTLADHQGEVTHPYISECDLVIAIGEGPIVARDQKIEARLQLVRRGQSSVRSL